jgi:hypothetical protein
MEKDQNPVHNKGYRNVFCPHYRSCLDYASKHYWECWTCLHCGHKQEQELPRDVMLSPNAADPYHTVSPSLCRKKRNNSVIGFE